MTRLTSCAGEVEFGPGLPTLLINDQLSIFGLDAGVLEMLKQGNIQPLLGLAEKGLRAGINTVDILVDHPDLDEVELLPKIAAQVNEKFGCFISLDSRNPAAIEASLKVIYPYKALINSVNAEPEVLEKILPLASDFGAAIVGIPIGPTSGVPHSVEGRLAEARVILAAAQAHHIPHEDIVMDGICLASAVEADSMRVTLETLAALISELEVTTILGVSNAGHGMPTPAFIELAYLLAAVPWGLHAALVNPFTPGLSEATLAIDFLSNRDPDGKRYLRAYRQKKKAQAAG